MGAVELLDFMSEQDRTAIGGHPVKFLTTSFLEKIALIVRRVRKELKCQRMKFPHGVRCWVLAFNNI